MKSWILVLATGFGLGHSRIMPGTCGTLLGVPLAWMVMQVSVVWLQVVILILSVLVAVYLSDRAEKLIGGKDPQSIVVDEYLTLPITIVGISNPWALLTGFIFHRIFDILKPPPIRQVQHVQGGWGIVLDDLIAAIIALFINGLIFNSGLF
jgi:phosphatidylglycerophosphatase A